MARTKRRNRRPDSTGCSEPDSPLQLTMPLPALLVLLLAPLDLQLDQPKQPLLTLAESGHEVGHPKPPERSDADGLQSTWNVYRQHFVSWEKTPMPGWPGPMPPHKATISLQINRKTSNGNLEPGHYERSGSTKNLQPYCSETCLSCISSEKWHKTTRQI